MYKCITNHHLVKILMNNKVVCKLPQKYHVWKRKQKQWIYIYIASHALNLLASIEWISRLQINQPFMQFLPTAFLILNQFLFFLPSNFQKRYIRWRNEEKFKKAVERYGMDLKTSLYIACISKKERKKGYLFCADDLAS